MAQELDLQEKEKLEAEEVRLEIYTYLLMLTHTTYLKGQMRTCSLSFPYHLLTLHLEPQLKFQL